jgi:hypothetical protein
MHKFLFINISKFPKKKTEGKDKIVKGIAKRIGVLGLLVIEKELFVSTNGAVSRTGG